MSTSAKEKIMSPINTIIAISVVIAAASLIRNFSSPSDNTFLYYHHCTQPNYFRGSSFFSNDLSTRSDDCARCVAQAARILQNYQIKLMQSQLCSCNFGQTMSIFRNDSSSISHPPVKPFYFSKLIFIVTKLFRFLMI
ncbi:hypothetical protein HID58_007625 [Brassica napus]|uniref:Uncharacterized protein n=1 Tax=Brassica napus TaxID=3708 RepID=A0ABQ8EEY3_BRANA|nr:hypothetical protein HID58_007625 [Brassica napus]